MACDAVGCETIETICGQQRIGAFTGGPMASTPEEDCHGKLMRFLVDRKCRRPLLGS